MAVRRQFLQLHSNQEKELSKLFQNFTLDVIGTINRYSDLRTNNQSIRKEVGKKTTALFLSRAGDELLPFVFVSGILVPLSPYMAIIWSHIKQSIELAVTEQQQIMAKELANAPDVLRVMQTAINNPLEDILTEFTVNENKYDPTRAWAKQGGYNLSDRIWQTSVDMRSKLDAYLDEAIQSGKNSTTIARELEQFLIPGKQLPVTNKPYGRNASFNAMRLARTELSAAFSRTAIVSAKLNPFIAGYKTRRSTHKIECPDYCDPIEQGGPYSLDDTEHLPPLHSHCLCSILWVMQENKQETINQLRNESNPLRKLATALNPKRLLEFLLSFYK